LSCARPQGAVDQSHFSIYNRNFKLGLSDQDSSSWESFLKPLQKLKESIMARLVKRFRNQPYAVAVGGEIKSICGCGLSATQPFCDGTHKISESEASDKLYWYDDAGQRHTATDSYPSIRSDKQPQEA